MSTNHGGVCLLYRDRLHARLVNTTQYTTFEHIIDNHSAFRRGLKTHLFHIAFWQCNALSAASVWEGTITLYLYCIVLLATVHTRDNQRRHDTAYLNKRLFY